MNYAPPKGKISAVLMSVKSDYKCFVSTAFFDTVRKAKNYASRLARYNDSTNYQTVAVILAYIEDDAIQYEYFAGPNEYEDVNPYYNDWLDTPAHLLNYPTFHVEKGAC